MKKLNHLAEIYKNYDTYIIDLWGVIHDGVRLNPGAMEAVKNLVQGKKKVVLSGEYNSDNTDRLDVTQMKELLLQLPEIKNDPSIKK